MLYLTTFTCDDTGERTVQLKHRVGGRRRILLSALRISRDKYLSLAMANRCKWEEEKPVSWGACDGTHELNIERSTRGVSHRSNRGKISKQS